MRRALVLLSLVALLAGAPAALGFRSITVQRDLDGDSAKETVRTQRVDLPGVDDEFDPGYVQIVDTCGARQIAQRVSGRNDNVNRVATVDVDGRRGREVFFDAYSGASARNGEARVVAWRRAEGATCRRARYLFRYTRPTRRPRGTTVRVGFQVGFRDYSPRYRGREVKLAELFCCPSVTKTTYWRYSRRHDRFVVYRTRLTR